jgi:hypothetical protein
MVGKILLPHSHCELLLQFVQASLITFISFSFVSQLLSALILNSAFELRVQAKIRSNLSSYLPQTLVLVAFT